MPNLSVHLELVFMVYKYDMINIWFKWQIHDIKLRRLPLKVYNCLLPNSEGSKNINEAKYDAAIKWQINHLPLTYDLFIISWSTM